MNKKTLKQLAAESFTQNKLDEKKIEEIKKYLNSKDLKVFTNELKECIKKLTVYVDTAMPLRNKDEYVKELRNLFPNREIEFRLDPSLILGVRIIDNDNVFEINMKNSLNKMEHHMGGIV